MKHTILLLAADPSGTDRGALDREARAIQTELERSGHRDRFEFETRWAVEPLDLLREIRKLKPTVVHFSGHRLDDARVERADGLFFQGADGRAQAVSAAAITQTFGAAGTSVKLVVLSACYSETHAEALLAHVDCVVGMTGSIHRDTARNFAIGFYGGLAESESIGAAYDQGRAAISLEGLSDGDRPRLKTRAGVDANRLALIGSSGGDVSGTPRVPRDGEIRTFARSDHPEFRGYVQAATRRASRIILVGTGINVLHSDPFADDLFRRAAAGKCRLEIFLADPDSPAVESRLIEEELGHVQPTVGDSGLRARLQSLVQLRRNHGNPSSIEIRVFSHYPTLAIIVVDDEIFMYPYGLQTLGNFSPVLHFVRSDPAMEAFVEFLDDQIKRVRNVSVDAEAKLAVRERQVRRDALTSFALYYVPPADSPLYRFGSRVIGYDVYTGVTTKSSYTRNVGTAAQYGFHLTVCDALHFLGRQADLVINEVKYLLRRMKQFRLRKLRVVPRFPSAHAISLAVDDPSGTLEVLHAEMLHRVYRLAAASNYSLGQAGIDRTQSRERTDLAMSRYRVPYVLGAMKPHFTLLSDCPAGEQDDAADSLANDLAAAHQPEEIWVDRLQIMELRDNQTTWTIQEEIRLV